MPTTTSPSSAALAPCSEPDKPARPLRCDVATVQRFLAVISEQAARACAGIDGYLQISRVHPVDDRFVGSGRFLPGDVDAMVEIAVADADAGFNTHVEAR